MPVVALRGLVVLPGRVEHFDVSRRKSMAALEDAMLHYQKVLLVTQKNPDDLDPGADGLFEYGTLCEIRQMARLPKENGRVMVEGVERVRITSVIPAADMLKGEYVSEPLIETDPEAPVAVAMVRVLRDRLNQYARGNRAFFDKYLEPLLRITDVNRLLVRTAADMNWEWQTAQALLECDTADELYSMLVKELTREISVNEIRREFQEKLKGNLDKNQRDYVLREQMKLLRQELGDDTTLTDADEFSEQVEQLEASEEVKTRIRKEIYRLKSMPGGSQEGNVVRTYLETLLDLPWDHCSVDNKDLKHAEDVLNEDHYGLEKVKERVLEYLAVRLLNPDSKAPILCLVGPPGTGKTSIAKSVARALDRQYVRISLGGVRDEAEIRGHRKTYVGAMPGRIVEGLRQAGTANPLMLLDEVDKVSSEYRGATASALLEVLDGEQNVRFRDGDHRGDLLHGEREVPHREGLPGGEAAENERDPRGQGRHHGRRAPGDDPRLDPGGRRPERGAAHRRHFPEVRPGDPERPEAEDPDRREGSSEVSGTGEGAPGGRSRSTGDRPGPRPGMDRCGRLHPGDRGERHAGQREPAAHRQDGRCHEGVGPGSPELCPRHLRRLGREAGVL